MTNSQSKHIIFAIHDAFAASLVEESMGATVATDGDLPEVGEVLTAAA